MKNRHLANEISEISAREIRHLSNNLVIEKKRFECLILEPGRQTCKKNTKKKGSAEGGLRDEWDAGTKYATTVEPDFIDQGTCPVYLDLPGLSLPDKQGNRKKINVSSNRLRNNPPETEVIRL